MLPVIAIIGRPNVGKSTLFNCLTKSRAALVADYPGLTRDRQYGEGRMGNKPYIVIDTGGLTDGAEGVEQLMAQQVWQAMSEADAILFVVDAKSGLAVVDEELAQKLRQLEKPVYLVVNKTDGADLDTVLVDFYELSLGQPYAIAATHGRGITTLINDVLENFPVIIGEPEQSQGIKIAFVGRPNVGKSTLINRILGEEREVVHDKAGTTRDSIFIPFTRHNTDYVLIDTAGIRRRGRVTEGIEKFSIVKALQAIDAANVVVLVIDAHEGIADQDLRLLGFVLEAGRALVIAVNKWDGIDIAQREHVNRELSRKLTFIDFAAIHFISALHGTGVGNIFTSINKAFASATKKLATPQLTKILQDAVSAHEPPLAHGRRIKLKYAHAGGSNPPIIVIHGVQTDAVSASYKKYLEKTFRKVLKLIGTPIRIEFVTSENPYAGRRNILTPRQIHKRQRLKQHTKGKKK